MTEKFSQYVSGLPITSVSTPGSDLLPILQGGITERAITPLALFGGIPLFGAVNAGIVPQSGGGTSNFLRADGNWVSGPPSTTPLTVGVSSITGGVSGRLLSDGGGVLAETALVSNAFLGVSGTNIAARFGSMDVWQRGAGNSALISAPASTTTQIVDGWYLAPGANQLCTVGAVAGIAPGSFKAAQIFRNAGQTGTGFILLGAPFDSDEIALFAGQFVTLSFTATTGANWSPTSGALNFSLFCGTGVPKKQNTGYTGQNTPIATTVNIPAGTASARYQLTSAAIVPANTTQAEIQFSWQPTGTAGAIDSVTIDDVQLEVVANASAVATPYQKMNFEQQLSMAQRHFAKTFPYGTAPANAAGATGALWNRVAVVVNPQFPWRFPRQMRTTPVITTFNPVSANANARDLTANVDLVVVQPDTVPHSPDAATIIAGNVGVNSDVVAIHATADASI